MLRFSVHLAPMKLLRLVLLFVLMLALPSLGLAGVATSGRCNMASMSASAGPMAMMDCGGSADSSLDGKLKPHGACKMDASCKTFGADQPLIVALSLNPLPLAQAVLPHPATLIPAHDPEGLWRPPQPL